ncbi:MAG: hypothetical protein ACK4R7_03605 [Fervidobacterium sp.]
MRKLLVLLAASLLIVSLFAAGSTQFQLQPTGSAWSQTLTFSVRQWIKVTWDYDETQPFAIDDATGEAQIGNIAFQSNKQFRLYYAIASTPALPAGVSVTSVKVGTTALSNNSSNPTNVVSKQLNGTLIVTFTGYQNLENDFQVKFDFTFLPLF